MAIDWATTRYGAIKLTENRFSGCNRYRHMAHICNITIFQVRWRYTQSHVIQKMASFIHFSSLNPPTPAMISCAFGCEKSVEVSFWAESWNWPHMRPESQFGCVGHALLSEKQILESIECQKESVLSKPFELTYVLRKEHFLGFEIIPGPF